MKRLTTFLILALGLVLMGTAFADQSTADLMLVGGGTSSAMADTNVSLKDNFLKTIQVYLISAYGLIAVGIFIFIGFRLFNARGNPQEFKQAWVAFAYTVVGLSLAPLAFVIVRIVTGFSIS